MGATRTDGDLIFGTKIDDAGFKKGTNTLKSQANQFKSTMGKLGKSMADSFNEPSSRIVDLNGKISQTKNQIAQLQSELDQLGNSEYKSQDFITMQKQAEKAQQKLLSLLNTREELESQMQANLPQGLTMDNASLQTMYQNNTEWQKLTKNINAADMTLSGYEAKLGEIKATDSSMSNTSTKAYQDKQSKLQGLNNKLSTYEKRLDETRAKEEKAATSTKNVGKSADKSSKQFNAFGKQLKMSFRMIGQMLIFTALFGAMTAMKDGIQNLVQYSNSYNRAISGLLSSLSNLKNALTTAFAPIIEFASPYLQAMIDKISEALNWIAQFSAALLGTSAKVTTSVKVNKDYAKSLEDTASAADDANKKSLASFDTLNVLSDNKKKSTSKSDSGDSVSTMFTDTKISESAQTMADKIKKLFEPLKDISFENLNKSLKKLKDAMEPLKKKLFEGLHWAWTEIFVPLATWTIEDVLPEFIDILAGVLRVFNQVLDALKPIGSWFWNQFLKPLAKWEGGAFVIILDLISKAVNGLADAMERHPKIAEAFAIAMLLPIAPILLGIAAISTIIQAIGWLIENWSLAKEKFFEIVNGIKEFAINTWTQIKGIFSTVSSWFYNTVISPIETAFTNAWNSLISGASAAWEGIKSVFSAVGNFFKNIFSNAWIGIKSIFSEGGELFNGIKDGVVDTFKRIVNALIQGINVIMSKPFGALNNMLNSIKNLSILGGQPFKNLWSNNPISIPQIPRLATGAVIPPNSEFLALLGDQKSGTNIEAPLDTIVQAMKSALGGSNYGNITIRMPVRLSGKELYEEIVEVNNGVVRQTGKSKIKV